jgi:hypothetical protein
MIEAADDREMVQVAGFPDTAVTTIDRRLAPGGPLNLHLAHPDQTLLSQADDRLKFLLAA